MNTFQKHKNRMKKIKEFKATSQINEVSAGDASNRLIGGEVDHDFLKRADVAEAYSNRIDNFDLSVSDKEVSDLITSLEKEASAGNILEPVFLGLLDGTMRSFKIGTKQGLTASRLYGECKNFSYDDFKTKTDLDSYTQSLIENENISEFDKKSSFSNGELSRENEDTLNMRDGAKMNKVKDEHFADGTKSSDAYNPNESIYRNKKHAKSVGEKGQSAEADHVVPCAEICNQLKSNKALNPEDIKDIVNVEDNLVITSKHNNRGAKIGKFDKSQSQLQKELDQGYVVDKNGKKTTLTKQDKIARSNMVKEMGQAQKAWIPLLIKKWWIMCSKIVKPKSDLAGMLLTRRQTKLLVT